MRQKRFNGCLNPNEHLERIFERELALLVALQGESIWKGVEETTVRRWLPGKSEGRKTQRGGDTKPWAPSHRHSSRGTQPRVPSQLRLVVNDAV